MHDSDEFAGQSGTFLHQIVLHQVFQISHDDGEGRTQLVGGVCHEVPAHLVGEVVLRDVAQQDALFSDWGVRDGAVQMPRRDAVLHAAGGIGGAQREFLGDGAVRIECFLNMPQQFLVADQGPHFAPFQLFFLKKFFGQRISQHDVSGWTDEQEGLSQSFQEAPFVRNGLFLRFFPALQQALSVPQGFFPGFHGGPAYLDQMPVQVQGGQNKDG